MARGLNYKNAGGESGARLKAVSGVYGQPRGSKTTKRMGLFETLGDTADRVMRFGGRNNPANAAEPAGTSAPAAPATRKPGFSDTSYLRRKNQAPVSSRGIDLGSASPLAVAVPKRFRNTVSESARAFRGIPVTPRGGKDFADRVDVSQRSGRGLMSGIEATGPMNETERTLAQGRNLRQRFNDAPARSAERADILREIWERGGSPIIGRGAERAPVQDFGGVDHSPRGIDTGMRVGSPEALAHAERLAQHQNQSGIYGSPTAPYARLAPTRGSRGGGGLFTGDRVIRRPSREDRAHQQALELARIPAEAQAETARANLEAAREDRAADRDFRRGLMFDNEAIADRRRQEDWAREDAADNRPPKGLPGVVQNGGVWGTVDAETGEFNRLPDADQQRLSTIRRVVDSFPQSVGAKELESFRNNPTAFVPVYDYQTGRVVLKPSDTRGWTKNWQNETIGKGKAEAARYQPLMDFDPTAYQAFLEWAQSAAGAVA